MERFRLLILLFLFTTHLDVFDFCGVRGELFAPQLSDGKTVEVGKPLVLRLNITEPEVDPSTVWLKLTDRQRQQRNLSSYLTPLELADNVLQWTLPNVTLNESGHYYVHTLINSDPKAVVACLTIDVGLPPSYINPGSPDAQTDLYCVTYSYKNTSCWWDAGRPTNLKTNYTLYYATRPTFGIDDGGIDKEFDGKQAKFNNWNSSKPQLLLSTNEKRVMHCDPPGLKDKWYYATKYVFFVKAENALGSSFSWNAGTNKTYFIIDMKSILKTSPTSNLSVPRVIGSGDVVNCAWPKDSSLMNNYIDHLFAEISYDPVTCDAAKTRTVRVGIKKREGGVDKVRDLTPGVQYRVTVRIRPNATMMFDRDIYWSSPVVKDTVTADARPTGVAPWWFANTSTSLERAFEVKWEPLGCELRGSAIVRVEVEVTRTTADDFYYNETVKEGAASHLVRGPDILPNAVYKVRMRALNTKGHGPWSDYKTITTNPQGISDGKIVGSTLGAVIGLILVIFTVYCCCRTRRKMQREKDAVDAVTSNLTLPMLYEPETRYQGKAKGICLSDALIPREESCESFLEGSDMSYALNLICKPYDTSRGNPCDTASCSLADSSGRGSGKTNDDEKSHQLCVKTRNISADSGVASPTSQTTTAPWLNEDCTPRPCEKVVENSEPRDYGLLGDDELSPSREKSQDSGLSSSGIVNAGNESPPTIVCEDGYNSGDWY